LTGFKVEKIRMKQIMKSTRHQRHLDFASNDPPLGKTNANISPAHDLMNTDLMPLKPLFTIPSESTNQIALNNK
jgi:hypothetical protein